MERGATYLLAFLMTAGASQAAAQPKLLSQSDEAYLALESGSYWIHASAKEKISTQEIQALAKEVRPFQLKVLVVPELGPKWFSGGEENRSDYLKWLYNDKMHFKSAIVILYTKNGIAGYSPGISETATADLEKRAAGYMNAEDFVPAIRSLAIDMKQGLVGTGTKSKAPEAPKSASGPGLPSGWPIGLSIFGLIAAGGFYAFQVHTARNAAKAANKEIEDRLGMLRRYLDFPIAEEQKSVLAHQCEGVEEMLAVANAQWRRSYTVGDFERVKRSTEEASNFLERADQALLGATSQSRFAFRPVESLSSVQPEQFPILENAVQLDFFTGEPLGPLPVVMEVLVAGFPASVQVSRQIWERLCAGEIPSLQVGERNGEWFAWFRCPAGVPLESMPMQEFAQHQWESLKNPFCD